MRLRIHRFLTALLLGAAVCLAMPGGAWPAENEGGRSGVVLDLGKLVNLVLVVAVLIWVARKPLASFFASRSQAIRDQLAEAQRARLEAEARLAEIEAAMSSLDDELRTIREAAAREAEEEHRRLTAAADRDAEKIVETARREIDGITRAAQSELKEQVAELSVQLAKHRIQAELTEEDRTRLFARFVASVGGRR